MIQFPVSKIRADAAAWDDLLRRGYDSGDMGTIQPVPDTTEHCWNDVAMIARAFEQAAAEATSVDRCRQLHERVLACLQTLNDADDVVRACWDARLAKGEDV